MAPEQLRSDGFSAETTPEASDASICLNAAHAERKKKEKGAERRAWLTQPNKLD